MDDDHLDPNDPLDAAWIDLCQCFHLNGRGDIPIQTSTPLTSTSALPELSPTSIDTLHSHDLMRSSLDLVQSRLNAHLREVIAPSFWSHFSHISDDDKVCFERFRAAVDDLFARVSAHMVYVRALDDLAVKTQNPPHFLGETSHASLYRLLLKGTLHSQMPDNFESLVDSFYSRAFHVFNVRQERFLSEELDDSTASAEGLRCNGCDNERDHCVCPEVNRVFDEVNRKLLDLDLLERLSSNVLKNIVHSRIEQHVQETCKGSFTISHISSLENWLGSVVMLWIRQIYASDEGDEALDLFERRLRHFLYETYTKTRIEQLFNIIIEFPDSQSALEDLKDCLERTDMRSHLTGSLKAVLQKKLLHLGVNTTDILTAYIAAIRALRVLDPTGVVLELVCEPVRKYLRTRDDTVRCIVQSLIDDNNSELADELRQNEGLFLDESFYEEEEMDNWETWTPDPVDAKRKTQNARRTSDIISMLVNIYGSKELFVNEYRSLLSNRLLAHFTYETDKEIRNLELLKLRFGEAPLHQCEVMLKDIGDSKRINSLLHGNGNGGSGELANQEFPVNSVILSAQFWPQLKEETLQLPKEILQALEVYTKAYEAMKGNRTLVWKTHLGFANIDLEIGEKKINLTVSPVHAAIICQFTVKAEWTAEELSQTLKIPVSNLRRKIVFWQTQGLVKETATDRYALIEEGPMRRLSGAGVSSSAAEADDEADSVTRTSKDQREDELKVFWLYIYNMLMNLETLPLARIHQMLKVFAMQGMSGNALGECDIEELRDFLDKKVREHKLVFSGGQYRLPPKA